MRRPGGRVVWRARLKDVEEILVEAIMRLTVERDGITGELKSLVKMLRMIESSGTPRKARQTQKTQKTDKTKQSAKTAAEHATALLREKPGVTPADVAKRTGQSLTLASQTLQRLVTKKIAKRLKRGVYAIAK